MSTDIILDIHKTDCVGWHSDAQKVGPTFTKGILSTQNVINYIKGFTEGQHFENML